MKSYLAIEKLVWSKIETTGDVPKTVGYHSASSFNETLVIFGGSDTKSCFSDITALDTTTNIWVKKKVPSVKCRFGHTAIAVGSWLFVFGGNDGNEFISDLEFLNMGLYFN